MFIKALTNWQGLALWGFLLLHESIHLPEHGESSNHFVFLGIIIKW